VNERPITVLVVDDDWRINSLVTHLLGEANFLTISATNAADAWNLIVQERPDAGVVDLHLPDVDGWQLIERIRADGRFARLPLLLLTGDVDPTIMDRAASLGCEYLGKPFAAEALLTRLRRAIEEGPGSAAEGASPKIATQATDVIIVLADAQITGKIHLPPEVERFSDGWESVVRDGRLFVPVTGAVISTIDGRELLRQPFVSVAKAHIRFVFPAPAAEG
jgi:DNA-binding response OmpR family regulator